MGGNPIQFDYTLLATFFSFILFLVPIYLIVSAIRFFKRKAVTDQKLLQKLDELIRLQTQRQSDK